MPAKSMKQQRLMGAALAAKRGEGSASKTISDVAKGMTEKQLKEFATKPRKGYKK